MKEGRAARNERNCKQVCRGAKQAAVETCQCIAPRPQEDALQLDSERDQHELLFSCQLNINNFLPPSLDDLSKVTGRVVLCCFFVDENVPQALLGVIVICTAKKCLMKESD